MISQHNAQGKVGTTKRGVALASAIPTDTPRLALVPTTKGGFQYVGERERINKEANRKRIMPYDKFLIELRETGEIK